MLQGWLQPCPFVDKKPLKRSYLNRFMTAIETVFTYQDETIMVSAFWRHLPAYVHAHDDTAAALPGRQRNVRFASALETANVV